MDGDFNARVRYSVGSPAAYLLRIPYYKIVQYKTVVIDSKIISLPSVDFTDNIVTNNVSEEIRTVKSEGLGRRRSLPSSTYNPTVRSNGL